MEDWIILIILIGLVILGILSARKHFRGHGGCCSGGEYRPKKRLPRVIARKKFAVAGMQCVNCRNRVEEAINDIEGVAGKVNLRKKEVTVLYAKSVPDEVIIEKITRAGYTVLGRT